MNSNLAIPPLEKSSGLFVVDSDVGISLLIAHFFDENTQNLLIVTPNLYKSQKIYNLVTTFVPAKDVLLFPCDELIRAETLSQSKEMTAQRIFVLSKLIKKEARIVIANLSSASRYLPSPTLFESKVIDLKVGDTVDISTLKKKLLTMGYQKVAILLISSQLIMITLYVLSSLEMRLTQLDTLILLPSHQLLVLMRLRYYLLAILFFLTKTIKYPLRNYTYHLRKIKINSIMTHLMNYVIPLRMW